MIRTFKYRIYPTKSQVIKFQSTLDLCRELYNAALEERKEAWRMCGKSIGFYQQCKELTDTKTIRTDLNFVDRHVLEFTLSKLDKSFQAFFRRVKAGEKAGYPRFKSKDRYDSFTYRGQGYIVIGKHLKLSKIGSIKIRKHRNIEGVIKTCTIKRTPTGKWFACFACEVESKLLKPTGQQVGIDVGLNTFAALSNGSLIDNPRFFRRDEKELAKAQRRNKKKVARRIHERIANRRSNFANQLSIHLVKNYDLIVFENLNVKGMLRSNLSKSISDAAWTQLREYTRYKAENAGRLYVEVNPKDTSQHCSRCQEIVKKDLSVRIHDCPNCGLKLDRDVNAARNILALGLQRISIGENALIFRE